MHEHKVSLYSKHKYYPVVNCSLPSSAKGSVESFLSFFYNYTNAPRPQMGTSWSPDGRTEPALYLYDEGSNLRYPYCGTLPNNHLKSLLYGVDKEDPHFNLIYKYDQYSDLPWTYSYRLFDEIFPNAKFILTERNPEDWYLNILGFWRECMDNRWCNPILNDYWSLEKIPPITCDFNKPTPLINYQKLSFDENVKSARARTLIRFYKNYNQQVKDYFKDKKDKLLLLEAPIEKKEFELIADFLEKPMPKFGFFEWRYNNSQQTGYDPMAKKQTASK